MNERAILAAQRVLKRVEISESGCWLWHGANYRGYGQVNYYCPDKGRTIPVRVYRLLYEYMVGPIPDGLEIDHLCMERRCCNPDHLEPVTRAENLRRSNTTRRRVRKRFCIYGHPRLFRENGTVTCVECNLRASRAYRERKRVEA